jgi:UPF0716 family protein affecting phage T7 exclusion
MIVADVPMTNSVVNVVTAVATLVTAITALCALLPVLFKLVRDVKNVHTIVNQQHTDAMNFQRALIRALKDGGIEVPRDQSVTSDE